MGDEESIDEVFRNLSFRYPRYANLSMARPHGRVLGKAAWESHLPENLSGELVRQAILRNGIYLFLAVLLIVPTAILVVGRVTLGLSRLPKQVRVLAQAEEGAGPAAGGTRSRS